MRILRHARFSVTTEIYTQVSSTVTREALKRPGDSRGTDGLPHDSRRATSRNREAASDLRN